MNGWTLWHRLGQWAGVLALTAVALALSGCSSRPQIEYRISGTAAEVEVFYRNNQGEMVQDRVEPPWTLDFRGEDPFSFELSAYGDGRSGTVACAVWINGQEVGNAEGKSYAECFGEFAQGVSHFRGRFDVPGE